MLGQAGESPCPPNSTYYSYTLIGSVKYCIYLDERGMTFMIQC